MYQRWSKMVGFLWVSSPLSLPLWFSPHLPLLHPPTPPTSPSRDYSLSKSLFLYLSLLDHAYMGLNFTFRILIWGLLINKQTMRLRFLIGCYWEMRRGGRIAYVRLVGLTVWEMREMRAFRIMTKKNVYLSK